MSDRRQFIKRVGVLGTAGVTALSGCTGGGGGSGGDTATPTEASGGDEETDSPTPSPTPTPDQMNFRDGEIDMNVSPSTPQEQLDDQYAPVRDHLSEEIGLPAKMNIANNYSAVIQALGSGTSDVAETGPFAAALGVRADKAEIILQRKGYGSWTYVSTIVTRKGSGIESLEDLKEMDNPTVAFADRLSTSGALYPLYDMKTRAGIDIGNLPEGSGQDAEFEPVFAGGHTASYETLVNGQADAAGMGGFVEGLKDSFSEEAQYINKHEGLPRAPIVVSPKLSDKEKQAVTTAFTEAPDSIYYGADGEQGTDDDLWFNAVRKVGVDQYQDVINAAKELGVGTDYFEQ
jgi:phosphonate transport system substrate-binding protein